MDHWRMARRMGLSSDEFRSLTPAQFSMFVDDWWDAMRVDKLQMAQLESTIINLFNNFGRGENDPPIEPVDPEDLITVRRVSVKPGMVKTVDGWVSEDDLRIAKARIQQQAEKKRNDKIAGMYRG